MLSEKIRNDIELRLDLNIVKVIPVTGGDINNGYCLDTAEDKLFVKVNSANAFPQMFKREQEGLEALTATHTIAIPQVLLQADIGNESYLVMEWIAAGKTTPKSSQLLGEQLAALHRTTHKQFGFANDNYMGSLLQRNDYHDNFPSFFISQRLQPMVAIALTTGRLTAHDAAQFERLYNLLPNLTPPGPPAMVHGDLWGGNYLINNEGQPYLIDPAVSYSHREVDIALSTLFGGFGSEFYHAYQTAWSMETGWQERLPLWNLYPLLVHVNLFGGGYAGQVREVLKRFT